MWLIFFKYPVRAGDEFVVTTDLKYSEASDNHYMFVDYVSFALASCM